MPLYRLGKSAIDPETIEHVDGDDPDVVTVLFRDGSSRTYTGADAEGLRRYVERLPDLGEWRPESNEALS